MSKRKPWFNARVIRTAKSTHDGWVYVGQNQRIRITDARELTPEKAVERVLQIVYDHRYASYSAANCEAHVKVIAEKAGMTARVVNGMVRVKKIKKLKTNKLKEIESNA